MFWVLFFGLLFFVPAFGMAIGTGLGALFARIEKSGIDKELAARVRGMVTPGSSAVFLVVEGAAPERAVGALARFGGSAFQSSLSSERQQPPQDGSEAAATA